MFAGSVKAEDGSRRDKEIQAEKSRMIEDGRPPDWFTKFAAKKKINVIEGHLENDEGGAEPVRCSDQAGVLSGPLFFHIAFIITRSLV